MSSYTQDARLLMLETPLGGDALLLTAMSGYEEMSRPFSYRLDMLSERASIAPQAIVGKKVTFSLRLADGSRRPFSGYVSRFSSHGQGDRLWHYSADIVPWTWFLQQRADCRIFQQKTIPQIIEEVLSALPAARYEIGEIKGTHPRWDYCVQYRETDHAFISRLMEQEGIFYSFRHDKEDHVMVLADTRSAYRDSPEKDVRFASSLDAPDPADNITAWQHRHEFRPGRVALNDYNFETPSANLLAKVDTIVKLDGITQNELYDFPGEYETKADGEADARLRMEEQEAAYDVVMGESRCMTFSPGQRIIVKEHHRKEEKGEAYVLTSVQHHARQAGSYLTGPAGGDLEYRNTFQCVPAKVVMRPQRLTPRPVIQGVQTAVVVGPSGQEIHTDQYGRIKVQFHWDRRGRRNEQSSCWVRVAQVWAGRKWGAQFIPRVGQEVVVQFLDGDPDRPLVVGSVYNAEQMPPYAVPDNKTRSGIKSNSSQGGGGSNELHFEDKKGSEDIFFHAQKDFHRVVEHDDDLIVRNNQTVAVTGNRTETVEEGNEKLTIARGNRDVTIDMGNESLKIKMGNRTTEIALGKDETRAMQSITLRVGQSELKIDQTGISLKGMVIKVDGQMVTDIKGMMTNIKGSAMLQAGGGITMIG